MIVPVVVEGQSLRWYGRIPEIADNSIEFVQLEFRFPEDWDNMVIVAQFTQTKTYNCLLVNNRCFLPMELVAGPCEISVFGYLNEEVTRGTTIPLKLNISRSGFVSSAETPIPPTPDLYAQLIDYFSSIAGSGGGGSGSGTINPEDIAAAVEDYLSKNPPEVPDLSDEVNRAETAASNAEAAAARAEEAAKVTTDLDTTLTQAGKAADAKAVGDAISKLSGGNVAYDEAQELTDEQKAQARENIGAQPVGSYLESTELTSAINTALAQAKKSGEFDGADGYTPVKGVDYFDGEDGKDGVVTVTGATVGQTVKISAVDENGVPTAWEPVEFPSGGGEKEWTKEKITLTEDVSSIELAIPSAKRLFVVAALYINNADNSLTTGTEPIFISTNGFISGQLATYIRNNAGYWHVYEIEKIGSHGYVKRSDVFSDGIQRNHAKPLYVNGWTEMTGASDTAETINRLSYATTSGNLFKVGSAWEVYYQ